MKQVLYVWMLLLLALTTPETYAQSNTAKINHYSVAEGLSARLTNCLYQDARGYIWVGTRNGINRFDGQQFQSVTTSNSALPHNMVVNIQPGPTDDWLYLRFFNYAEALINTSTMEVKSIDEYFSERLNSDTITYDYFFSAGPDDYYLKDTEGLIYRVRNQKDIGLVINLKEEGLNFAIIRSGLDGSTWLECQEYTIELDDQNKLNNRVKRDNINYPVLYHNEFARGGPPLPISPTADYIYEHQSGKGRVPFLSLEQLRKDVPDLPEYYRIWLVPGTRQAPEYWIASDVYLKRFNTTTKELLAFDELLAPYQLNGFSDHIVDNSGLTWISTNEGIFNIDFRPNPFKIYLDGSASNNWMSIRTMIRINDELITTSYSGNRKINLATHKVKQIDPERKFEHWLDDYAGALHLNTDSILWLGGFHLIRYDLKADSASYYDLNNVIWTIYEDDTGDMYVGTEIGMYKVNHKKQVAEEFIRDGQHEFKGQHIHQIYEDKSGKIWVLSDHGLYEWSVDNGVIAHYHREGIGKYFLPENDLLSTYEAPDGSFWIATKGSGIIYFRPDQGMIRNYTMLDGLSNNVTYGILPDGQGNLWISSDYGLMQFSPETGNVKTFLIKDGLSHDEFNTNSYYKDWEGNMYFGGLNGLIRFHPDSLLRAQEYPQPELRITAYNQLNGATQIMEDRTSTFKEENRILLPYQERSFAVSVLMLDYRNTDDLRYAYRMEGVVDNWIFQTDNQIQFQGLIPGKYTLEIKGVSYQGSEGVSILSIPVEVGAPFYQQTWFILSVIAVVFGLIYLRIYMLRQSARRLKEEVEKSTRKIQEDKQIIEQQASELVELDMAKSQFFTNISHELRTPLSLIYGPLQVLKRKPGLDQSIAGELEKIEFNSFQLKDLVDEILDLSRLDSNKIELKRHIVDIHDWFKRTVLPWEAKVNSVEKHFSFQSEIPVTFLQIDEKKLEKIVYNLISNALKFTTLGGHIEVSATWARERLTIKVKDDGQGIPQLEQERIFDRYYQSLENRHNPMGGLGIGLSMSAEFARLMDGSLSVESQPGKGSTFTLSIQAPVYDQPVEADTAGSNVALETEVPMPSLNGMNLNATILVVEDHNEMKDFIRTVLEPYFKVVTQPNGKAALKMLTADPTAVNAIISDIMMPEMDGFELLTRVKQTPELYLKPMILLTARAGKEDRLNALRIGVDDYLTKPFLPDELIIRTQNLLRYRLQQVEESIEAEDQQETMESSAPLSPRDLEWLKDAESFAINHINDSRLGAEFIADNLHVSTRHLSRKLKSITGLNTSQYIQEVRLQQARTLLENGTCQSVKEVAIEVGFKKIDYFSKLFTHRMGRNPSTFLS